MTKSSASDNLLHVNCNVTNRDFFIISVNASHRLAIRYVVTGAVLKALLFLCVMLLLKICFTYLFIVHFVSGGGAENAVMATVIKLVGYVKHRI